MAKLSRNRLRELNEANSALRGNVPSQKTIFNDFVDRNNDSDKESIQVNENDAEPLKESINESTENSNMNSLSDNKDNSIEKDAFLSENKKEAKDSDKKVVKEVSTKNKTSDNGSTSASTKESKNRTAKKADKEEKKSPVTKSTDFTKKEYNEEHVNMTVFLTTELNDYLEQKAFMTGTTIKKVFKEIMTNQMNLEPEEELVSHYRKSQRYEARRVVSVPSELKEDIKLAAMKYRMRMSSFIIYALAVAKRDDKDF